MSFTTGTWAHVLGEKSKDNSTDVWPHKSITHPLLHKFVYVLCCFREHKQFLRSDFQFLSLKFAWQDTYIRKPHKATCTEIGWQQHFSKFQRKQQLLVSYLIQISSVFSATFNSCSCKKKPPCLFSYRHIKLPPSSV